MASYLIDKLEALKEDENKLKEEQRVLMEEIELEIEKKRRLELDGTITKLRTQVDEIGKNIEGKIMRDNFPLRRQQETIDFQKDAENLQKKWKEGLIDEQDYKIKNYNLIDRKQKEDAKYAGWRNQFRNGSEVDSKITLEKFKDNLSKVTKETKDPYYIRSNRLGKSYVEIPREIKIYDDIIPIFSTMIGIMKKQEFEIDNLKQKMANILKDI
jgi:hypothetical protein